MQHQILIQGEQPGMSASVQFTVPGTPIGKGRPRFVRKTGVAYTPAKTRTWEGIVRSAALDAMEGIAKLEGPLRVTFRAYFLVPQSWPGWKRTLVELRTIAPTTRPDLDNIIKTKDALNGICWNDDCQVTAINAEKHYDYQDARLEITIETLAALPAQTKRKP